MSMRDRVREGGFLSRMRRHPKKGWVAGVCYGVADYFDWNVKLLRVLCVLGLVFTGFFPIGVIYLLLWYLLDTDDAPVATQESAPRPGYEPSRTQAGYAYAGAGAGGGTVDVRARFSRLEERLRNMEEVVTSQDFELRRELRKLEGR